MGLPLLSIVSFIFSLVGTVKVFVDEKIGLQRELMEELVAVRAALGQRASLAEEGDVTLSPRISPHASPAVAR